VSDSKPLVPKGGIGKKFRAYFLTGLLVLVPLAVTYFIIKLLFLSIDDILNDFVSRLLYRFGLEIGGRRIPGIGFITLILIITFTGLFTRNYFGKKLVDLGDRLMQRIPLINRVYGATKQISQAFFSAKREVFKKAVLFEYPRKGIYSIGFYTQDTRGSVQDALEDDVVSVFLPTTPNPTSGFLLFVKKAEMVELDLTIEEALKLVISGGAIVPDANKNPTRIQNPKNKG